MNTTHHVNESRRRAVLYLRAAIVRMGAMPDATLESQRRALYEHAANAGYDLVGEHRDEGSADTAQNRAPFQMCMAVLRAGDADVLMVSRLDRIGRDAAKIAACVDEMDRLGAPLVTTDGQINVADVRRVGASGRWAKPWRTRRACGSIQGAASASRGL